MTAVLRSFTARSRRLPFVILVGISFAGSAVDACAQLHWGDRSILTERRRIGLAYDMSRERLVLFGGTETRASNFTGTHFNQVWEWAGNGWTKRGQTGGVTGPPQYHTARAIAVDPLTGKIVLVIPAAGNMTTYVWDGPRGEFPAAATTGRPSPRDFYALTFDEVRRRFVLWGGSNPNPQLDVWEFDGTTWHQIGGSGPEGRRDPGLAWDGNRGKVIMFGGRNMSDVAQSEMWEWDGQVWTRLTPATLPPARSQHSMVWDPNLRKVVLFGGSTGMPGTVFNDTWTWDGTDWTRVTTATTPPGRTGHGFAYHAGRRSTIISCGEATTGLLADMWEFDGTDWSEINPPEAPTARSDYGMDYDAQRHEVILFGGRDAAAFALNDTWRWRDSRWTRLNPANAPTARYDHSMVFDAARGNMVVFGGLVGTQVQNDTWLWDGTNWTQVNPATRPPARYQHSAAYDSVRQRVVIFGGSTLLTGMLADTWEWDGTNWTQVNTPAAPTARADAAMTYDAARGNVLLVGGRNASNVHHNDTWTYDGTTWTQRIGANLPFPRANMAMDYDPLRHLVYAFGGTQTAASYTNTTFSWNGSAWTSVTLIPLPQPPRAGMHLVWEDSMRRMVMCGGEGTSSARRSDVWVLTANPIAAVAAEGNGCAGGSPPATISGFGLPALGNLSFSLDLNTNAPPTPASPVFYFLSIASSSAMLGPCQLTVDPATLFFTAYVLQRGSVASMPLPIPANLNLFGAQFYAQCLYVDPPSPLNGLAVSRGAKVTLGDY